MSEDGRTHVVIVGGGFAGLACAKRLARERRARVTLVDRNGHHQFQPLLYQVATAELTPTDIAFDLTKIFSKDANGEVQKATANSTSPHNRTLGLHNGDTLS